LFNIYCVNKRPNQKDFENCFEDCQEEIDFDGFNARAGHDWSKCRTIAGTQKWNLTLLETFREAAFELFSKGEVFKMLSKFIIRIDQKYNDANLSHEESNRLYNLAKKEMRKIESTFFEELLVLINDTAIQIELAK